ncbi:hypothetical protein Tco_0638056 [Tanacetum coccineum]
MFSSYFNLNHNGRVFSTLKLSQPTFTQSSSTRTQAATRNRGKAIANSPPPTYDPEPEDEACSKEKDIDKLMALILITNKGTGYDRQTGQYDNQRAVNVVEARENVAKEWKKLKRAKDLAYHEEKIMMYKQKEARMQLSAEQADWRDDTDD